MWFFIFWVLSTKERKKEREEEKKSLYAYSFVVVHVVATVYNTLRRDRSKDNHTQVSLSRRGAKKTAEKRRRRRRKKKKKKSFEKNTRILIDSKGFEPRSNKTPGRDFSRSWSTRIRCDKPTFRTPAALHFSPLRCVLFWFTRRFPGVFFLWLFFKRTKWRYLKKRLLVKWMARKKFFIGKKSAYNNFIIWRVVRT